MELCQEEPLPKASGDGWEAVSEGALTVWEPRSPSQTIPVGSLAAILGL